MANLGKKIILAISLIGCSFQLLSQTPPEQISFTWTATAPSQSKQFRIQVPMGTSYTIYWGDGYTQNVSSLFPTATHTRTYALQGDYTVTVIADTGCSFTLLNINTNNVTALDISLASSLRYLVCHQNSLTSLNVSAHTELYELYCGDNSLTSLDLSNNANLISLYCYSNNITSLDLSANLQLLLLDCSSNKLTNLSLSNNVNLTTLLCENNNLSALDLTANTNITMISCNDNYSLENLIVTPANSSLNDINCDSDALALDKLYAISSVFPSQNLGKQYLGTVQAYVNIEEIITDVLLLGPSNIQTSFEVLKGGGPAPAADYTIDAVNGKIIFRAPGTYTVKMTNAAIQSNPLSEAEVNCIYEVTDTEAIRFTWNGGSKSFEICTMYTGETFYIDWGDGTTESSSDCSPKLHTYIDNKNYTVEVTAGNATCSFKVLRLRGQGVSNIDVSKANKLQELDCGINNMLGSIDVTNNTELEILYCNMTSLTSLDVTKNPDLFYLNCSANELTSLNLNNNPKLNNLQCENNLLINLDVTKNPDLLYLSCSANKLTNLDVTKNPDLSYLNCSANKLINLDVTKNPKLTDLQCENNLLTNLDVTKNPILAKLHTHENRLQLAVLYQLSQHITNQNDKCLGIQKIDTTDISTHVPIEVTPTVILNGINTVFTVTKNGVPATLGTDYTITSGTFTFMAGGTFTVRKTNSAIESSAICTAMVYRTYIVSDTNLAGSVIAPIPPQTYTGYAITPLPAITIGSTTLTKDTDYSLTYTANIDAGSATVTATGISPYSGSMQATFTIVPSTVTVTELSVQTKSYDGTVDATLLFDYYAFKQKLSPADTTTIIITPPLTGTFATPNIGIGISVTAGGNVTLGGAKASNYYIIQQTGLTGNIINSNTEATFTINNTIFDSAYNQYVVECGKNTVTVQVHTSNPMATVTYNGVIATGNQFIIDVSRPDIWTETFTVSAQDSVQQYSITLAKWFDVDITANVDIVRQKWNNTLFVNNNPTTNNGYQFISYEWFKNGIPVGVSQYYSAGDNVTDILDIADEYYVKMTTVESKQLRTCQFYPVSRLSPSPSQIIAYPNPVKAGQLLTIVAETPINSLNNAIIDIFNMSGLRLSSRRMGDNATSFNMPTETGLYIIKIKTADFEKNLTILVK